MTNLLLSPGVEANLEDILGKYNTQVKILEGSGKQTPPRMSKSKMASVLLAVAIQSNPDPDDHRMKEVRESLHNGSLGLDGEKNNELVKRLIRGLR